MHPSTVRKPAMRYRLALSCTLCLSWLLAACGQIDTGASVHVAATAVPSSAAPASAASSATAHAAAGFATDAATLGVGAELYKRNCFACHDTGAAGAPKRGDKAAWAPRIAQGSEVLHQAAINGINAMPARGSSGASDAEVQAAVDFIVATSR